MEVLDNEGKGHQDRDENKKEMGRWQTVNERRVNFWEKKKQKQTHGKEQEDMINENWHKYHTEQMSVTEGTLMEIKLFSRLV